MWFGFLLWRLCGAPTAGGASKKIRSIQSSVLQVIFIERGQMQLLQFYGTVPNKYQGFLSCYKFYNLHSAKKRATAFYTYSNSVMSSSGMRKFPTGQHESWCPTWGLKLSHCGPCPGAPLPCVSCSHEVISSLCSWGNLPNPTEGSLLQGIQKDLLVAPQNSPFVPPIFMHLPR